MRGGTDGSILGGHANPYAIAGRLMSVTFKAGFLYEILKDYAYTLSCIRTLFFYIARDAHVHSRPAYLPSAAKLAEWSAILEKETSMNKKLQIGIQIKEHFKTTHALFEAHAIYGRPMRAGGGTTLINKAAEYCAALHKKLLLSLTEEHILILASQLYTSLYALGLNASERDFVFMLNADRELDN